MKAHDRDAYSEVSVTCHARAMPPIIQSEAGTEAITHDFVRELFRTCPFDCGRLAVLGRGVLCPAPAESLSGGPLEPDLSARVRIYTLGQVAVSIDGLPLRSGGKARRRPLNLLFALISRGGRPVPVALLRKAMAEDETGDDTPYTRGAFDMALNRLRQMLGVPGLLQLGDGLLSLNEALCWVDAWAFERTLLLADRQPEPAGGWALLEWALDLYEGEFLAGEDAAWALLARERIRSRLLRIARRLGRSFEAAGRWPEAGGLYERLREHYPLDEELCLHLIRSHVKRNEFAQAKGIYARCRELLAKVLGVLPNPAIKAMLEAA